MSPIQSVVMDRTQCLKAILLTKVLKNYILEDNLPRDQMTPWKFGPDCLITVGGDAKVTAGSDPSPRPSLYRLLASLA